MVARASTLLLACTIPGLTWANTYTVTHTRNGGTGSLRWAIERVNAHSGPDRILFDSSLAGSSIRPTSYLPNLTDDETSINGDVNGDGRPDIVLNGVRAGMWHGLVVEGDDCVVAGLCITNFSGWGLVLQNVFDCEVRSCHVGVNLAGNRARPNSQTQIMVIGAYDTSIGGSTVAGRNIVAAGGPAGMEGIRLQNSNECQVRNCNIGIARDGVTPLSAGETRTVGITLSAGAAPNTCRRNTIGGTRPAWRNVIGGVETGIRLNNASRNTIQGNYVGLGRNGNTSVQIGEFGLVVNGGSCDNRIGGTTPRARNVFAGGGQGILMDDTGTESNSVEGNYFGMNAAGTARRRLTTGILVASPAGRQTIGGRAAGAGNYMLVAPVFEAAIYLDSDEASGTLVRWNRIGMLPDGTLRPIEAWGVWVRGCRVTLADNIIAADQAVQAFDPGTDVLIKRNDFRGPGYGVRAIHGATMRLGNLRNASTADDGGNYFRRSLAMAIENLNPTRLKAENNDFGTTSRAAINAKIVDRRDNPAYGRVDFSPLMGGVIPTGEMDGPLALIGLAAVPSSAGAQVAFSLSAPARVEVCILNTAGRSIKTLCHARDCEAGTNTLVWNAQSDSGLPVPNGRYLVEVAAKAGDGSQARALSQVEIGR
jgi:hypothetical protein